MTDETEEIEIEYSTSKYIFNWDGEIATLVRVEDRMGFVDSDYNGGLLTPVFNKLRAKTDNDLTMDEVNTTPAEVTENI